MYLQITNRCNMKCDHCAFSCRLLGQNMSLEVFRAALNLLGKYGEEYITIGGGEPTLHPYFEKMLLEAMAHPGVAEDGLLVVTNGSIEPRALMLAHLAKKGAIQAELSTDYFHDADMVSEEVVEAFGKMTRDVTADGRHEPKPQGRAVAYLGYEGTLTAADCACSDLFVKPNGDIHQCGCEYSPKIGDVWHGWDNSESDIPFGECYLYKE